MPNALITGASRGFGRAVATALSEWGWNLILDARGAEALAEAAEDLSTRTTVVAVAGDVIDPEHRRQLAEAVAKTGTLDLLVNNASTLGPSPLPRLSQADLTGFTEVLATNVVAPLGVFQVVEPYLTVGAAVVNVTSDAGVEAYEGWGLYGSSKAALDQLSAVLAAEYPELRVYSFDPGDMRTEMHQDAFPGEDISDRPEPEEVVPALLALLDQRPPSGRILASEMRAGTP